MSYEAWLIDRNEDASKKSWQQLIYYLTLSLEEYCFTQSTKNRNSRSSSDTKTTENGIDLHLYQNSLAFFRQIML